MMFFAELMWHITSVNVSTFSTWSIYIVEQLNLIIVYTYFA